MEPIIGFTSHIRVILGIMEKRRETTIQGLGIALREVLASWDNLFLDPRERGVRAVPRSVYVTVTRSIKLHFSARQPDHESCGTSQIT